MHELTLLQFVAVAMLILANAFFVAAEFALVSIRDTRIQQMLIAEVPGTRAVRSLQSDLDDFLPAVQLGVTLCSLALGWIGEPLAAGIILGWIEALHLDPAHAQLYVHFFAVVAGFVTITYFHVLVGELVPKSLALRRAEALAVAVAPTMLIFMAISRPAVRFLKGSAAIILRGFDISMTERGSIHSPEELKLLATAARRLGTLPVFQETLIHRALEMDDIPVREIMTPRPKIVSLPSNLSIEEASAQVIKDMHSRVPVYDETRGPEHIIGVVYSKDLARLMFFRPTVTPEAQTDHPEGAAGIDPTAGNQSSLQPGVKPRGLRTPVSFVEMRVSQVMRDVLVVPETKSVLDLIRDFQQRRRHMAIVVDEYGSTVGLVTAEDAIEQLIGELEDEFDSPTHPILTTASGAIPMDGGTNLRDLETQMQWSLPRDGGVETLAGFVLARLGHIPEVGESVAFEGRRMTVVEMEGLRIARILVEPVAAESKAVPARKSVPPSGKA